MSKFYTIKEVLERYNLKTRQSFYNWTKALNLEVQKNPDGKNIITEKQIQLLDQLSEHLKNGGTLKSFTPSTKTEVVDSTIDNTIDSDSRKNNDNNSYNKVTGINKKEAVKFTIDNTIDKDNREQLSFLDFLEYTVVDTVKNTVQEIIPVSPIKHWDEINRAVKNGYILTTKEVTELLGVKPKGNQWIRGAFKFIKVGKIGNQSAWKIEKISF